MGWQSAVFVAWQSELFTGWQSALFMGWHNIVFFHGLAKCIAFFMGWQHYLSVCTFVFGEYKVTVIQS